MVGILAVKQYLDQLDPRLWYLCIALLTGALIELWRRISPGTFEKTPSRVKALPAMLLGAVLSASGAADLKGVFVGAFVGILAGLTAVGGYEARVRLLSGQGTRPEPEPAHPPLGAEQVEPTAETEKDQGDGS